MADVNELLSALRADVAEHQDGPNYVPGDWSEKFATLDESLTTPSGALPWAWHGKLRES